MLRMRLLFLLFLPSISVCAETLSVHGLFTDGAILQRNVEIPIEGRSDSPVQARIDEQSLECTFEQQNWRCLLPPKAAGGPHQLLIQSSEDPSKQKLIINDLFFGDVYLASGQSNMELTMSRVQEAYPRDVAEADFPLIREFNVPDRYDFLQAHDDVRGQWLSATQDNIAQLSAVAYYTARDLFLRTGVPIGIINASLGGSPVEAWMQEALLKDYPQDLETLAYFQQPQNVEQTLAHNEEKDRIWYQALAQADPGLKDQQKWSSAKFDHSNWPTMEMPATAPFDHPDNHYLGSWWLRKTIDVSASLAARDSILRLGRIKDADEVYVNGVLVGNTTYHYPPRRYTVPAGTLKAGKNVIAIRVTANGSPTGFLIDKPYYLGDEQERIALTGTWHYQLGAPQQPLEPTVFVRWKPTGLFNGMIAPLTDFPIRGVFWYQGESNVGRAHEYADKLRLMIHDWRTQWNQPDLPFVVIQLANYLERSEQPTNSGWAQLRQRQAEVGNDPHNAVVVTIDTGEWNDIHPVNKRSVGSRTALALRSLVYGDPLVLSPQIKQGQIKGSKVELIFDQPSNHLRLTQKGHNGFAIAGKDGEFHWAEVEIKDGILWVWSDKVQEPTTIRYAWADNPIAGLSNLQGLPAVPFELDLK